MQKMLFFGFFFFEYFTILFCCFLKSRPICIQPVFFHLHNTVRPRTLNAFNKKKTFFCFKRNKFVIVPSLMPYCNLYLILTQFHENDVIVCSQKKMFYLFQEIKPNINVVQLRAVRLFHVLRVCIVRHAILNNKKIRRNFFHQHPSYSYLRKFNFCYLISKLISVFRKKLILF